MPIKRKKTTNIIDCLRIPLKYGRYCHLTQDFYEFIPWNLFSLMIVKVIHFLCDSQWTNNGNVQLQMTHRKANTEWKCSNSSNDDGTLEVYRYMCMNFLLKRKQSIRFDWKMRRKKRRLWLQMSSETKRKHTQNVIITIIIIIYLYYLLIKDSFYYVGYYVCLRFGFGFYLTFLLKLKSVRAYWKRIAKYCREREKQRKCKQMPCVCVFGTGTISIRNSPLVLLEHKLNLCRPILMEWTIRDVKKLIMFDEIVRSFMCCNCWLQNLI